MSIEALIELSNLYRLFLDYIIYGNLNEKKEEIPGKKEAVTNHLKVLKPAEYDAASMEYSNYALIVNA